MLKVRLWGIELCVSLLFPAAAVVMIALDTTGLASWCLCASLLHECGHLLALLWFGHKPREIAFGVFGMRILQSPERPLSYGRQAVVSVAGPLVNAVCALTLLCTGVSPEAALVHTALCLFNLLPIAPLDGGQALLALLCRRLPGDTADTAVFIISLCIVAPLTMGGFFLLAYSGYNFTLLAVCLYLLCLLLLKRRE